MHRDSMHRETTEGFPYPPAQRAVRDLYESFGADRMMWGSNVPPVLSTCTYGQALAFIRDECDCFNAADRAKVLAGTATRVLRLPW